MYPEIAYAAYLSYSPRGRSAKAINSQRARDVVKYDEADYLARIARRLASEVATHKLAPFLNATVTLVPAPRRAKLVVGGLWPALRICQELVTLSLGESVQTMLSRLAPVPKSAWAPSGHKPTITLHYDSMAIVPSLGVGGDITVVDDIVTSGSTLLAACSVVRESYPNVQIRAFGLIRTHSDPDDFHDIVDPCIGTIKDNGARALREP